MFKKALVIGALGMSASFAHTHISNHGAWNAFKSEGVCYVAAQPEKSEGNYTSRGDIHFMISFRPKEGVSDEVSTLIGYPFKKKSIPQLTVKSKSGDQTFDLFTQGEAAWTQDDQAVVAAMKKGAKMVVTGVSSRGTKTTDTYSLMGISGAYKDAKKACGM